MDKDSCTIVELPVIRKRYYTVQVLNAWGETVVNINERDFPERPAGKFGLCLRGVEIALPPDSLRIDLPGKKSRVLMRVERGANPAEAVQQAVARLGTTKNGWSRPATIGNYGPDFLTRTAVNLAGIWANNTREVVYFSSHVDSKGVRLNGSNVYTLTFPKSLRPESLARHFWSVTAVDSVKSRVIDNPLKRYLLNDESKLRPNKDGSVTLTFAAKQAAGAPEPNWLPTPAGHNFNLTFRFYGPAERVVSGGYFPPPLVQKN